MQERSGSNWGTGRRPRAVLIAGPTASGKSGAALALAERHCGTVINADSMQLYAELSVLTARPSPADEKLAPHRLYGIVSARERYSVGRWLNAAVAAIAEAEVQGRLPILVGGTGLYFKALLDGLAAVPEIPAELRVLWRRRARELPPQALHAELAARDARMAARLPATDPQRILRAIEVIEATGVSLADWHDGPAAPLLDREQVVRLVVAPERASLYAGIEERFDCALEQGAIEEVEHLLSLGFDPDLPAMRAHGVPDIARMLSGKASREEAVRDAKTAIRRYAKRQLTWARRFMADWTWVGGARSAVDWASAALQMQDAGEPKTL